MKTYIVLKGNQIINVFESNNQDGVLKSLAGVDYDEIRETEKPFIWNEIKDIRIYDNDYNIKTQEQILTELNTTLSENEVIIFDDGFKKIISYKGKDIYNKADLSVMKNQEHEIPTGYTELKPPKNYYKWSVNSWIIDTEKKKQYDISILQSELNAMDSGMIRVYEDLIDALILKNVIKKDDLPLDAQQKIDAKKLKRAELQALINS